MGVLENFLDLANVITKLGRHAGLNRNLETANSELPSHNDREHSNEIYAKNTFKNSWLI